MSYSRMIGENIQLELMKRGISIQEIAQELGYSEMDFHKIVEGVLKIGRREISEIANSLGATFEDLIEVREEDEYRQLVHCMGSYEKAETKDKILDYIDMYIELQEAVEL